MALGPVRLERDPIVLEPLREHHRAGIAQAAGESNAWDWMPLDLRSEAAIDQFMQAAARDEAAGKTYVFAVIDRRAGRIIGSTRFSDVDEANRTVEIGWTWYIPSVWGTVVNPTCKWQMLHHAFETWGANRVALKTDHLNVRSQAAIRKLGAVYEGTLRNHRVRRDGSMRHTMMYSILPDEWPAVKQKLEERLAAFAEPRRDA